MAQDTLHIRFKQHPGRLTNKEKKKILGFLQMPAADCNSKLQIACDNPGCYNNKGALSWDQLWVIGDFILASQLLDSSQVYFSGFIFSRKNTVAIWFVKNSDPGIAGQKPFFY